MDLWDGWLIVMGDNNEKTQRTVVGSWIMKFVIIKWLSDIVMIDQQHLLSI